jgi:integrase/recombinase XerC
MLDKFELYLNVEKRYSSHTVLAYRMDLEQFVADIEINDPVELKELIAADIRRWIVLLIESGISRRSVNRKLSSLRTFFKWMKKEGLIKINPMLKVNGPKSEKRLPSFAKESELKKEKLDIVFEESSDEMDRLMFELFYQTGIRLSELIELKKSDLIDQRIKVLGKRNKERIIPLSSSLFHDLKEFSMNVLYHEGNSDYLFSLKNGNKLYPKFVYRRINKYLGKAASLDKASPHVLRHTFATHMLNNGAGLETLKDLLGHVNLSATQVYTHNSFAKLNQIYSQAHPRGHKN